MVVLKKYIVKNPTQQDIVNAMAKSFTDGELNYSNLEIVDKAIPENTNLGNVLKVANVLIEIPEIVGGKIIYDLGNAGNDDNDIYELIPDFNTYEIPSKAVDIRSEKQPKLPSRVKHRLGSLPKIPLQVKKLTKAQTIALKFDILHPVNKSSNGSAPKVHTENSNDENELLEGYTEFVGDGPPKNLKFVEDWKRSQMNKEKQKIKQILETARRSLRKVNLNGNNSESNTESNTENNVDSGRGSSIPSRSASRSSSVSSRKH